MEEVVHDISILTSQTLMQKNGFAMILLHAELEDEDDIDDNWEPRF